MPFHEEHGNTFVLTMPCMSSSIQAMIPQAKAR
jgi:hypothetical protein